MNRSLNYHKTFTRRTPNEIRFDEARMQVPQNSSSYNAVNGQQNGSNNYSSQSSSRKRVNIVSFSPCESSSDNFPKDNSAYNASQTTKKSTNFSDRPTEPVPVYVPVSVDSDASMFNECRIDKLKSPQHLDVKVDFSPTSIAKDMFKIKDEEAQNNAFPNNTNVYSMDYISDEGEVGVYSSNTDKKRLLTSCSNKQKRVAVKNISENNDGKTYSVLDFDDSDDVQPPVLRLNRVKSCPVPATKHVVSDVKTEENSDSDDDCISIRPSDIKKITEPLEKTESSQDTDVKKIENDTKLKVKRDEKDLYVVIKDVCEPYKSQAKGEAQHSIDDIEFLIDGLGPSNPDTSRTLRNIVYNHGLMLKILEKLQDASKDYDVKCEAPINCESSKQKRSLISSASFMVSKTSPATKHNKEMERIRFRVKELLEHIKSTKNSVEPPKRGLSKEAFQDFDGRGCGISSILPKPKSLSSASNSELSKLKFKHICPHLPLTARDLVIESSINLGMRKSPEWFKNCIREGNILDTMAELIISALDYLKDLDNPSHHTDMYSSKGMLVEMDMFALEKLQHVYHYTRFLENMTYFNTDNQTHLVRYKDGKLISYLVKCLRLCSARLPRHPSPSNYWQQYKSLNENMKEDTAKEPLVIANEMREKFPPLSSLVGDQKVILDCLLRTFRLLVNVSYNEYVSDILGGCSDLLEVTLDCLLHLPNRLPADRGFDLSVLTFCLLTNICQNCPENRSRIVHLELPTYKPQDSVKCDPVEKEEDTIWKKDKSSTLVFDEIINLFLYREELAKNHDFEKDDGQNPHAIEDVVPAPQPVPEELEVTESGRLNRPTAPSIYDHSMVTPQKPAVQKEGDTIEEAGLKWRLIKRKGSSKSNKVVRKRKRIQLNKMSDDEDEDSEMDTDEDSDCENASSDEMDVPKQQDVSGEGDEEEDEFEAGGADVEFLTETQEEKDKLAENMSSALKHMDDSLVAACAALLLGCIMQTSSRYTELIRQKLPDGKFRPLAIMIAKLLSFLTLTKAFQASGSESIARIINILESQDMK